MKVKFILLSLIILPSLLLAQRGGMMNFSLMQYVQQHSTSSENLNVLVKGDINIIQEAAKNFGGYFKYNAGNIASVSVPVNRLQAFTATPGIERVEAFMGSYHPLDYMTDINAAITPVHDGIAPLPQGYDGTGVVMGFLDSGIDIAHPDFKNANGTTRIVSIWDQNDTSGVNDPAPYNYGREWTNSEIDAGTCMYTEHLVQTVGHGTNVAGLGAGNGLALNNYYGIATKADIVVVDVPSYGDFYGNISDGVDYIFKVAQQLGEPCVINASLGIYDDPHDGSDLASQLISNELDAQSGRVMVCAAGNGGNVPFHLGYIVHPDSSFTWFMYNPDPNVQEVLFDVWSDSANWSNVDFAIGDDQSGLFQFLGRTPYYNVSDFDFTTGSDVIQTTLTGLGNVKITMYKYGSLYQTIFEITPVNTLHYWRLITNGTGHFDCWSSASLTGASDMVVYNLPSVGTFPDMARYKKPDSAQTVIASYGCSDHVISAASFVNLNEYIAVNGTLQTYPTDTVGQRAITSSIGPTRDGRQKPDVSAPGHHTLVSGNYQSLAWFYTNNSSMVKICEGGMHNVNAGTSFASPVVAGIAALYLQKVPNASWKQVGDAIRLSATEDDYTGYSLPDYSWGYGKVNAFNALLANIIYGCTDPSAWNFNPLATVDDGTCLFTGINDPGERVVLMCYPNPFASATNFYYSIPNHYHNAQISVFDAYGRIMKTIPLQDNKGRIDFQADLSAGMYFYQLIADGQLLGNGKMTVVN